MILLNNRIYGLTKGQYSPTSPRGFVSKSSPYGTTEDPFRPAELCFGARGNFFARSVASDNTETIEILKAAYLHKGVQAATAASTTFSGVGKLGSPGPKPIMGSPAAFRALALASTASVAEGAMAARRAETRRFDAVVTPRFYPVICHREAAHTY